MAGYKESLKIEEIREGQITGNTVEGTKILPSEVEDTFSPEA